MKNAKVMNLNTAKYWAREAYRMRMVRGIIRDEYMMRDRLWVAFEGEWAIVGDERERSFRRIRIQKNWL